jgi:anti-anti-sigma regulatory factor
LRDRGPTPGDARVVLALDLRRVTFVDSTMLREILSAHGRGDRAGRRVAWPPRTP